MQNRKIKKLNLQVSGDTLNVKSRQLTYSQYAGEWDSKVLLIIFLVIISLKIVIIMIIMVIDDHHQDHHGHHQDHHGHHQDHLFSDH